MNHQIWSRINSLDYEINMWWLKRTVRCPESLNLCVLYYLILKYSLTLFFFVVYISVDKNKICRTFSNFFFYFGLTLQNIRKLLLFTYWGTMLKRKVMLDKKQENVRPGFVIITFESTQWSLLVFISIRKFIK